MANSHQLTIDMLASNPEFDFLKLIENEALSNDDQDISYSPYENMQYLCTYLDEIQFCNNYRNTSNLSVFSLNIQSLPAKFSKFSEFINCLQKNSCSPDIICLQEIWRFPVTVSFLLNGYQPIIQKQRKFAQGGGIGIYVKNGLKFKILESFSIFSERILETLSIEIAINSHENIKICNGTALVPLTQILHKTNSLRNLPNFFLTCFKSLQLVIYLLISQATLILIF